MQAHKAAGQKPIRACIANEITCKITFHAIKKHLCTQQQQQDTIIKKTGQFKTNNKIKCKI